MAIRTAGGRRLCRITIRILGHRDVGALIDAPCSHPVLDRFGLMYLVLSTSLHPTSRSRILARACCSHLAHLGEPSTLFDLAEHPLPPCDGDAAYADAHVKKLAELIKQCDAILLASPVYNFDVSAAAKNAVELTGRVWTEKVVGLLLAAGGTGGYMSAMGLAGSLMLDFRCIIVPRFVYATGESFDGDRLADEDIQQRVKALVDDTTRIARALARTP